MAKGRSIAKTSPYFGNPLSLLDETNNFYNANLQEMKKKRQKKRITSPSFPNPKPQPPKPKRITSPYFNNPNPQPVESKKIITSSYFKNPKPSAPTDPSSLKINNTNPPSHKSTTNSVDDDKDDGIKPPLPSSDHLPPIESFRYIPPPARRFPPVSPAIITAKAETDAVAAAAAFTSIPATVKPPRNISQCPRRHRRVCTFDEAAEPTAAAAPMSSSPPKKKRKRTSIVLSASQKWDEAYRR